MKVEVGPVIVTNDDGSEFARFGAVTYSNVPRDVYEYMEGEVLSMFLRWNEASKSVTSGKGKP
jgi:hypothetical protein